MAEFMINTQRMTGQAARLVDVSTQIKNAKTMISNANSGLSGVGLEEVGPALDAIEANLAAQARAADALSLALGQIVLKFIAAESSIMGIPVISNPEFLKAIQSVIANNTESLMATVANTNLEINGSDATVGGAVGSWMSDVGDILHAPGEVGVGILPFNVDLMGSSDWTDLFDMDNPYFDQAETLHMVEFGPSVSGSVWEMSGGIDGQYGSLEGSMSALTGEAHATAWGGFLDENGHFAPGIGVEAGVSASLFEANGEARLGNQYLGMYAEAGVEVGHVEASVGVSAGLYDGDGNFNPSLGASAEAEAVLAQASGSVGGTVMGTDIGVAGSVGVGVGAHANVGIQDGVLSVDVGAYVGVGGSVGLTIDFNDTYDTIVDAWDATTEAVGEAWDGVTEWAGDTWDAATDWASDAWDTATSWWPF